MSDPLLSRREFHAAAGALLYSGASLLGDDIANSLVGPLVGHVSATEANLWCRAPQAGPLQLIVRDAASGAEVHRSEQAATSDADLCVQWSVDTLDSGTEYAYVIFRAGEQLAGGPDYRFRTPPDPTTPSRVTLALGSCADTKPLKLWRQIGEANVDGLVLLGDTPYIDTTDLTQARQKHRDFLKVPELAALVRQTPTWGTWDDHDFGGNNTDGRLKGKANTRRAFVEYRANREYGHDGEGIYTAFRTGPVEVFLLDTRWFARTEPSPVDPSQPTLLGKRQWEWLRAGLKESTAPFKLIACGMIWDDKENRESDDWGSYAHERSALFRFLGEESISGAILIGGDIHCSRLLQYKTDDIVGYAVRQFIVSPIHGRTIPSLNVPHPDLVRGAAIPHVWLKLTVDSTNDPARLHASWEQMDGRRMWDVTLTTDDLRRPAEE